MGKILLWAIIILAALIVVRLVANNAARRRAEPPAKPPAGGARPEAMVRCTHCGIHLPRSEAVLVDGQTWCSEEHARLGAPPMMLRLDRHGWLAPARGASRRFSPNHDDRPRQAQVSLLVIHNISLPPGQFGGPHIERLFTNTLDYGAHPWLERLRGLRVSAHFLIRRDGAVVQFVSTDKRAWHAGVSRHAGRERCNDFSIGIELEGTDTLPYTDAQYAALAALTQALRARYPLSAVRGHEHIAPGRKTDPGPAFDWPRYGRMGGWARRLLPPN